MISVRVRSVDLAANNIPFLTYNSIIKSKPPSVVVVSSDIAAWYAPVAVELLSMPGTFNVD